MKRILIIISIIIGLLLVLAVALPLFLNVDTFRPTIQAQIGSALGRKVQIGHLQLSLLAGGITAEDISIADDPAFSSTPFLKAKALEVGVDLPALIFSRELRVRSFLLKEPEVALLHSPSGKWNFSSLGRTEAKPTTGGTPTQISVQNLNIEKARIAIGMADGKRQVYDNVNLQASQLSYTTSFPFLVTAATPGGGSFRAEGHAGPVDREDTSNTPFDAKIDVKAMDLSSTGFVPAESGIAGVLDYNGTVQSNGKILYSEGNGTTQKVKLVKGGSPARQPVGLAYASNYDLKRQTGTLERGEVRTGSSVVKMSGNFDAHGKDTLLHLKLTGRSLPVQDLAGLLPALGVALPMGSSLQSGTVGANLGVDGALDRLVTTGTLDMANVKLAGFSLGSKMAAIAALAGIRAGADTTIQAMSSKLRIAPEGIRADDLSILVPELGTLTGAGTMSSNNALNFKFLAKLNSNSANLLGGLTKMAGLGQASSKGIPFMVKGTSSNPVFVPDVAGALQNTVTPSQEGLGGILGGFFGKKKEQTEPRQ